MRTFITLTLCYMLLFGISASFLSLNPVSPPKSKSIDILDDILATIITLKISETVPNHINCEKQLQILQNSTAKTIDLLRNRQLAESNLIFEASLNETRSLCHISFYDSLSNILKTIQDPEFLTKSCVKIHEKILSKGKYPENEEKMTKLIKDSPNQNFVGFLLGDLRTLNEIQSEFNLCPSDVKINYDSVTLDYRPMKGITEGFNFQGKTNSSVNIKQVQIILFINGNAFRNMMDTFQRSFSQGDPFRYRYQYDIPPFFPSVFFF